MLPRSQPYGQLHNPLVQLLMAGACGAAVGAAALWVPPLLTAGALVGIPLAFFSLKRPELILLVFLVFSSTILAPEQEPAFSAGVGTLYLSDVLLLTLVGLIVLRRLFEPQFKLVTTPLDWPLALFVGFAVVATLQAIWFGSLSLSDSLGELRIFIAYLLFFAVTNLVRNERQVKLLIYGMLALTAVVGCAMIAQYIVGNEIALLPGRVEALQTEGARFDNITRILPPGQSLALTGFLVLLAVLTLRPSPPLQFWYPAQLALAGAALLLTFNRNFWVAAAVAILVMLFVGTDKERERLVAWLCVMVGAAMAAVIILAQVPDAKANNLVQAAADRVFSLTESDTFESPDSSLRWRDFEYVHALPHIVEHPVFGLGLGATYRPWLHDFDHIGFDGRGYIHNGHVWIMLKAGLLSYACLVGASAVFLIRGLTRWRRVADPFLRATVLAFCLVYIGVLLGSLVNSMLVQAYWTPVIAMMMGINEVIFRGSNAAPASAAAS
jgi:hypothetical protein